jgi:signal peptidase I
VAADLQLVELGIDGDRMRSPRSQARGWRAVFVWAGVVFLVTTTVVLVGWRVHGGRWVRVETPSMGTTAPVGTLLWVAPVRYTDLRPGDLITFSPPGAHGTTYTHLVRAINSDGTISTQGRITSPDPWRIGPGNVVGKVVLRWRGVGWLVLGAPVLLLGGLAVSAIAGRVRDRDVRVAVAVVGGSLVIVTAFVLYRPLTQADQMSFVPVGHGVRATYVSTGLLPVRVSAAGGTHVVLHDGEVGSVRSTRPASGSGANRYAVSVVPAVPTSWWVLLIALCVLPAVGRGIGDRFRLRA